MVRVFERYTRVPNLDKINRFFQFVELYDSQQFKNIGTKEKEIKDVETSILLPFVGCFPKEDKKGILIDYRILVPEKIDIHTTLIWIHERIHAIILENRIGEKLDEFCESEILPVFYERLFIMFLRERELLAMYEEYFKRQYELNDMFKEQKRLLAEYNDSPKTLIKKLAGSIKKD